MTLDGDMFIEDLEKEGPIEDYSLGKIVRDIVYFESMKHRILLNQARNSAIADHISLRHQLEVRLDQLYGELNKREQKYLSSK